MFCFLKFWKINHRIIYLKKIPQRRSSYITRNLDEIPLFKTNHNFLKNSLFPSTTIEWNNLDHDLRNTESYTLFRSSILKFIRPSPNSFYGCQNIMGIKLVTRLRLGLSHLREHKFKHSFQDTLNPLCNCGMDVESSTHFLLQCPSYINERCTVMSNLNRINPQIPQTSLQLLTNILLFDNSSYGDKTNTHILNATIDCIQLTKRFDEPLFWLTLSWRRPISYRNQSIDLQSNSMNWFLYDIGLCQERVKAFFFSDLYFWQIYQFVQLQVSA